MLVLLVYFFDPGGILVGPVFDLLECLTEIFGVVLETRAVRPGGQKIIKLIFLKHNI